MTIINNTLRISLRRPIRSIRKSDLSTINSLAKTFIRHQTNESTAKQIVSEPPRVNQVGIQYLSESLHKKVFPNHPSDSYLKPEYPELLKIAEKHLKHNDLLNRKTQITEPINIENFPDLVGNKTLDEHFYKIGKWSAEPYLSMAEKFFKTDAKLPKRPQNWQFEAGWYRYVEGKEPESVPFPLEDELVFDVEVLYKKSPYAVLATCVSQEAWYGWVSPFLTNYAEDPTFSDWEHLIPFNCLKKPKLLVGYNVSYDRSRVADEYNIKQSQAFYLDGMALHVAISGICSQQRPKWQQHKKSKNQLEFQEEHSEEISSSELAAEYASFGESISQEVASDLVDDPWLNKGAPNSLANVLDFHCKIKLDKSDRDFFSSENPMDVIMNFNKLMDYCATDVEATYTVTKKLLPEFREKVPHPVSFAALRHLGTLILPTTKKWENYIETAEKIYTENRGQVTENLKKRANELIKYIEQKNESLEPNHQEDPWLRQLNWTIKKPRLKKDGSPSAKQAYLTGYPEWYRELFKTATVNGVKQREMNLTVRTRITPLLLRLKWEGYPLVWTESQGWCFKVPYDEDVYQQLNEKNYSQAKLSAEDMELLISELRDDGRSFELFKVPHPDGPNKRCTLIMSKSYLRYFEDGTMTSEYNYAQEILSLNSAASYWMGNRTRITEQFVVYNDTEGKKNKFFDTKRDCKDSPEMGIILPKLCTMGTITRRATENTWLTASNAKRNRIGSELKSLIEAPKGYCFVGADVDSEELWIASLVGDSMFRIHGGTALGWMTLEGDKTEKTDLHSKTAEILGISRNDAKVFNYGRIYGAGVKFATRLLKQFNSKLSDDEAERIAKKLYASTKGEVSSSKALSRRLYHGGTESVMFNALESIAYQKDPRTPVLGAAITAALTIENLNKNNYLTSRINWAIQSSGVDYLHLLVVSMEYLIDKYQIDARLAVTVHDELRYLVREDDKYKAALLLQISNLWTRAMFCEQLGITEVPQSCAFFSEVDIDHVLRKEVHMDCITPSNPIAIPPGESLSIGQLLDKCENGKILIEGTSPKKLKLTNYKYPKRNPVILKLDQELDPKTKIASVRLQNSIDKDEWKKNINIYIKSKKDADFDDAQKEFYIPLSTRTKRRSMEEFDVRVEGIDGNALLKNDVMQSPIKKPRKEVTKVAKPKVYEKRIEKSPITNGMTPTKMVSTKKVKSAIKYTPYSAQTVKSSGKPARWSSTESNVTTH
ncbi:mitochondrial DNA polymerase catalytic subunit [Scheffersomyces xylosifermentans]|uniref:mitochondrial DNA polymerase catalytic subunit n=1 Tax=Scheffersomyces xylosifermentans TaxID=1304137 RepID=UPI00315CD6B2